MTTYCAEPGCTWKAHGDTDHCWNHRGLATPPNKCPGPGHNGQRCGRDVRSRGLCTVHRRQQTRTGELKPIGNYGQSCRFDGCTKPHWAHGLCRRHAAQSRRDPELSPLVGRSRALCDGPGKDGGPCGRIANRAGKCESHRRQLDRGEELAPILEYRVTATCTGPGVDGQLCGRKATRTGLCDGHKRQQAAGNGLYPIGQKAGGKCTKCGAKPYAKGLCKPHYQSRYVAANPRVRKTSPKANRPKPAPTVTPPEPWNPGELKHADTRPPKPAGRSGIETDTISKPTPLPAGLVHAMQNHYLAHDRGDLLTILGIEPGNEQIPLAETRQQVAA